MIIKSRYWSIIGWVESLPENWKTRLKDSNLQIVISPLHNKDIVEETGEIQKPHYHILVSFDGPTTLNNVQEFALEIGLGEYVERVRSVSNLLDYMTHDSYKGKGKANYSVDDIEYINCTLNDFVKVGYWKIIEFIKTNNIHQFNKLVDSLIEHKEMDLLEFVSQKSYYVNLYLSSLKIDIDKDFRQTYAMLKGYCEEVDRHGKFTIDREHYAKLMDLFEQLDIFSEDI